MKFITRSLLLRCAASSSPLACTPREENVCVRVKKPTERCLLHRKAQLVQWLERRAKKKSSASRDRFPATPRIKMKIEIYMEAYGRGRSWSWVVREVWAFGPILLAICFFFFHFQIGLLSEKSLVISFRSKTQNLLSGKTFAKNGFARNTLEIIWRSAIQVRWIWLRTG